MGEGSEKEIATAALLINWARRHGDGWPVEESVHTFSISALAGGDCPGRPTRWGKRPFVPFG
jgi:hypothetical protein